MMTQLIDRQLPTESTTSMDLIAAPSTTLVAPRVDALAVPDGVWDQARYDAEIRSACRQMQRGLAELAEGKVRLATILVRLRETQDYRQWGFTSLEAYLRTAHQVGSEVAYACVHALTALGPEQMRQLLIDVGAQRTYCLAQIRDLDPEVFEALLALPDVDGRPAVAALTMQELEDINTELRGALEAAYQRYADKEDELAAAKQISQVTRTRISEIDLLNRDLVVARDRAEREKEQVKRDLEQERKKKGQIEREAKRAAADLQRQLRELSDKLRRPIAPNTAPVTIEVIAMNDPRLLAGLAQLCAQGLRGVNMKALHTAAGPAQALSAVVGELIAAGVPTILIAAVRACATAVREALEPGVLTLDEATALRAALDDFGATVAPVLHAGEVAHD